MTRELRYAQAICEALDLSLTRDPSVYVMGLGVSDPKGLFGSTIGLVQKHGPGRVMDMPCSENGMTGVALGSALVGMRPVMTHQRIDFALLAMDQIANQAAKWRYMFGGRSGVPLVVRMIVGRGWGQGPQHSQALHGWLAHIPGLKVVVPTTPHDVKGLLIAAIEDPDPVIVIEHRWLYQISGPVPEGPYRVPLGTARTVREGRDLTVVACSYMTLEALRAADTLASFGVHAEVIDLRSVRPLDAATIHESVRKTGRLLVADIGWEAFGVSAEIVACAVEHLFPDLKAAPVRIGLPPCPAPTTPALAEHFYPRSPHLVRAALQMLGRGAEAPSIPAATIPLDQPDASFTGPF